MVPVTGKDAVLTDHKKIFTWDMLEPLFRFVILSFGIVVIWIAVRENIFFTWKAAQFHGIQGLIIRYLLFFSGLIFVSSLVFRTFLWFRYRPYNSDLVKEWPEVTVIVPAYNEGENVYHTLTSLVQSDYPADRLRIITINDVSADNTLEFLEKARASHPDTIEIINFAENRGKREGIYASFQKNRSPFFVTLDSDTRLDSRALKKILTPMLLNEKIAAVTGRIRVDNFRANIFTRMLNAHFAMAFDFTRAVQSTFSNVLCLSGAFSAYRSRVLSQVIDQWRSQTFLNRPCTYGEDRSLTNHILRTGMGTAYQQDAVSYTIVPEQLGRMLKMLTRWARSNIRESFVFSGFMFNRQRRGNRSLPFFEFFATVSLIVLHFIWFYYFLFSGMLNSTVLFRILSYTFLFGFFYMLYYVRIEGRKDFPYIVFFSLFSAVFMIGIFTVAGFSLTKKSWATR